MVILMRMIIYAILCILGVAKLSLLGFVIDLLEGYRNEIFSTRKVIEVMGIVSYLD